MVARTVLVSLVLVGTASTQSIEAGRERLRSALSDVHFAKAFAGLMVSSEDLELGGAEYDIDVEPGFDLSVFTLPGHTRVDAFGEHAPGLRFEGVIGYSEVRTRIDDVYDGEQPAIATSVDSRYRTWGALGGVGPEFDLAEGLTLSVLAQLGAAHIDSHARYGGPGAPLTAAVSDGIVWNWSGLAAIYGGAVRADWRHPLGERHALELVGRYDVRRVDMVEVDDPVQDFATTSDLLTLRCDLTGPTDLAPFGDALDWRLTAGYRRFGRGDLFGVREFFQLGGALELRTGDDLPVGEGLALTGAVLIGENLRGWSLGLSLLF